MKKLVFISIAFFTINLVFAQGILTSSDNTELKIKLALNNCSCSDLIIPDGVIITIADQLVLVESDINLIIQGSGRLAFRGKGKSKGELHLSENSKLTLEDPNNRKGLFVSVKQGKRIFFGDVGFASRKFNDIITAGGADMNGIFPVKLAYFEGIQEWSHIALSWATAVEKNSDHIKVERSNDSENWEVIGEIECNSTTDDFTEYSFVDANPNVGQNYYRLKQYHLDVDSEATTNLEGDILSKAYKEIVSHHIKLVLK